MYPCKRQEKERGGEWEWLAQAFRSQISDPNVKLSLVVISTPDSVLIPRAMAGLVAKGGNEESE